MLFFSKRHHIPVIQILLVKLWSYCLYHIHLLTIHKYTTLMIAAVYSFYLMKLNSSSKTHILSRPIMVEPQIRAWTSQLIFHPHIHRSWVPLEFWYKNIMSYSLLEFSWNQLQSFVLTYAVYKYIVYGPIIETVCLIWSFPYG